MDIMLYILNSNFDYKSILKGFIIYLAVLWFLIVIWAFNDFKRRYKSNFLRILFILFIAPFNLLGLIVYTIIRKETDEDKTFFIKGIYTKDFGSSFILNKDLSESNENQNNEDEVIKQIKSNKKGFFNMSFIYLIKNLLNLFKNKILLVKHIQKIKINNKITSRTDRTEK